MNFTSMSTCTTPVDLRFGRLRRWIIACVAWPLRLSFSLSFSVHRDSLISRLWMFRRLVKGWRGHKVPVTPHYSPLSSSDRFGVTGASFSTPETLSDEFCRRGTEADKFVVLSGSWVVPFVGDVGGCGWELPDVDDWVESSSLNCKVSSNC